MTLSTHVPAGGSPETSPAGDTVTATRATLTTDQYLYTSHAHLELVCLALKSGHQWQINSAVAAAQRHLDHHKDQS